MFKPHIVNALFKPFQQKCEELEFILENTNNIKELSSLFELLVKCIFGIENELNLTQNDKLNIQWPFKLVNKFDYEYEYSYMFKFLNTDSLLWSIVFKLCNLNVNFKYPIHLLPIYIKARIESGHSVLASRLDTINCLNLNALEYYLICFTCFIINIDQRTPRSDRYYNEQSGKMNLNCIYSDLLENYLNYFLPINKRDVHFPTLTTQTTVTPSSPSTQSQHLLAAQNQSLHYPRLLKQTPNQNTQFLHHTTEQAFKLDRSSDLQKIDFFVRLIVDLWLSPFNNDQNDYLNTQLLPNIDIIFAIKQIIQHVYSFSNVLNSSSVLNRGKSKSFDLNNNSNQNMSLQQTPIDELRLAIVDNYFKRPIYKFLKHNLENWPLAPSIKFLIETWLCYIQPWRSIQAQETLNFDEFIFDLHPSSSIWSDFIRDNLFTYVDIFKLIIKRYCIIDLTLISNLQLLYRICLTFTEKYLLETVLKNENDIVIVENLKINPTRSLTSLSIKREQEQNQISILKLFRDFDKQITNYKSLFSYDNQKLFKRLVESLINTKGLLLYRDESLKKQNTFFQMVKTAFSDTNEQTTINLNQNEINTLVQLIDECSRLLNRLIEPSVEDDHLTIAQQNQTIANVSTLNDENRLADYVTTDDGTLKLSPRGRYQILHGICKTNLEKVYDPDVAAISDFENRFLVFVLQRVANVINNKFHSKFQELYNRDDIIGHVTHKCLYGPLDLKNKIDISSKKHGKKHDARLSLRFMADYRFLFYFLLFFLISKSILGLSTLNTILLILICGFNYILVKSIFSYKRN